MSPRRLTSPFAIAVIAAWLGAPQAHAALTPADMEKEVLRISKKLHPIPDDEWKEVAGDHAEERYAIVKGDTLYDISKRLFGDSRYWPKIWALNNNSITNPHLIRPGNTIAFMPGTGTDVPLVKVDTGTEAPDDEDSGGTTEKPVQKSKRRSQEWKKLPTQPWDRFGSQLKQRMVEIGMGFNKSDKLEQRVSLSFDPEWIIFSNRPQPLGEIESASTMGIYPFLDEVAIIRAAGELGIGETYAVVSDPEKLISPSETNPSPAYAFPFAGRVKILEKRGDVYVGKIAQTRDAIERGFVLLPMPKRIPSPVEPRPGAKEIAATVLLGPSRVDGLATQSTQVYLDRGTNDGVDLGMVFRVYQHRDRETQVKFTNENFLQYGELIVIQASERFSLALVTRSDYPIEEGDAAFLQTDVGEVQSTPEVKPQTQDNGTSNDNELDKFQQDDNLTPKEKKELHQLEKWKSNPPPAAAPAPETAPPADSAAPPAEAAPPPADSGAPPSTDLPPPPPLDSAQPPAPSTDVPPPPPSSGSGEEALPPPPAF